MPPCEEIDGEEDNVVMSVLEALEDMLYESVTLGTEDGDDDNWNSCESKHGANLREEIEDFEARAIDEIASHGDGWEADEYPLELTSLHERFAALVEGHVEAVLKRQDHTVASFVKRLEDIETREGWTWARDGAKEVISLLTEVDNFRVWASNIKRKAAKRRHK